MRNRLINLDVDIVAIKESKLQKAYKTPSIEGYATIRKDRNSILGGGLLFFVRNDVIFEKLHTFEQAGMKILSVRVRTSKSLWIEVYNIYLPNTTTQQTHFDPNLINPSPHSIIIGDFNSHSHLWDHVQPPDAWGNNITDWIINKDQQVLNDGSATRSSWITAWQHTWLITLQLQLVNQNFMDTSIAFWQFRPPTNCHRHQPQNQTPTSHFKEG